MKNFRQNETEYSKEWFIRGHWKIVVRKFFAVKCGPRTNLLPIIN